MSVNCKFVFVFVFFFLERSVIALPKCFYECFGYPDADKAKRKQEAKMTSGYADEAFNRIESVNPPYSPKTKKCNEKVKGKVVKQLKDYLTKYAHQIDVKKIEPLKDTYAAIFAGKFNSDNVENLEAAFRGNTDKFKSDKNYAGHIRGIQELITDKVDVSENGKVRLTKATTVQLPQMPPEYSVAGAGKFDMAMNLSVRDLAATTGNSDMCRRLDNGDIRVENGRLVEEGDTRPPAYRE